MIQTINPATGTPLEKFDSTTPLELEKTLARAQAAQRTWRSTAYAQRAAVLRTVASRLRAQQNALAAHATQEMGKPLSQARAEVQKSATGCEHYAEHGERYLSDELVPSGAAKSVVGYRPLGTILAVMPWNFPYWQVFRAAAPALMAGNGMILKHASNVSRCALEIDAIFAASGAPTGLFATVLLESERVAALIADPRISAVTLTGSEAAGMSVASAAGNALKKTVLELGGSDPFIVLADADIAAAATIAVKARFQNNGQSCIAAKRFIVEDTVYDAFLEAFTHATRAQTVGDPMLEETDIGPVARDDLRDALNRQVRASVAQGARITVGGNALSGAGFFYEPTIVADVTPEMAVFREETFGPAAAVIRARDASHALALANDSDFGLGANIWSQNIERAMQMAAQVESGSVFINSMTASDPRLPFGGIKRSGYGRELGAFGIREFVNIQTIWVAPSP
ncbi:MAG: NAD-dependent succinate-semialdehyde dehydrogenase [Candidatus Eremiobacteraeota bacterium]|nr:NAD-dependent succinate-semialdehyde dehydrogenase [Candidatus Eremiobacteraeota bacterium]